MSLDKKRIGDIITHLCCLGDVESGSDQARQYGDRDHPRDFLRQS
jgi:hypothetical protein